MVSKGLVNNYTKGVYTADEVLAKYPRVSTEKDVGAVRAWLLARKEFAATATFACASNGRINGSGVPQGGCHASIIYEASGAPGQTVVGTLTSQHKTWGLVKTNPEVAKRWFTYLLNDCYYSPFFLNYGVEDAMKVGLFVDLALPTNLVHGACILSRASGEKKTYILVWDKLVQEHGVDPDVAFLLVWGTTLGYAFGRDLEVYKDVGFYSQSIGHTPIAALTFGKIKGWLGRTYSNLREYGWDKNPQGSYGLASIICDANYNEDAVSHDRNDLNAWSRTTLKDILKGDSTKTIASPFGQSARSNSYPSLSTVEKRLKEVIDLVIKKGME